MIVRPRFDPSRDYTAARSFTYNGVEYVAGDAFDKEGIAPHKLNTLYGSRAINMAEKSADPVKLTQTKPGYFEITAPWLDEPEKVRGKAKAEERLAELREAGEPDAYKGVSIEGGDGGWYDVKADWMDEPVKVQGEDKARAEANRLRAEGPPPEYYALVEVLPVEGETDLFDVRAPWLPGVERITGEEAANARAEAIRKAGPPEDFDATAKPLYEVEAERQAEAKAEADRKAAYAETITITNRTEGEGDDQKVSFDVVVPGEDKPENFATEEEAKVRQTELRDAGPPKGWTPAAE